MNKHLITKSIEENKIDLLSLERQFLGIRKTTISKERLAELIQTKKDNIARLELQLNK